MRTGPKNWRSERVRPGTTYATTSYKTVGTASSSPEYPATLSDVKKYSPGESCRNRTPCSATGASRKTTSSFAKQKHARMAKPVMRAAMSTRSRSSSRCSHTVISSSESSSSGSGARNFCIAVLSSKDGLKTAEAEAEAASLESAKADVSSAEKEVSSSSGKPVDAARIDDIVMTGSSNSSSSSSSSETCSGCSPPEGCCCSTSGSSAEEDSEADALIRRDSPLGTRSLGTGTRTNPNPPLRARMT
mmetsp:Transcript_2118/g.5653  ORF Transcript_2118/g.5653 Transcript_2118/m.5653 type:complete len:246 (+) Transcript_2118:495-1232(+)